MTDNPFFRLHSGLDREGPGDRASVDWALAEAGLAPDAVICDAGCGPGADLGALLDHVPQGRVEGVDAHEPFIRAAAERYADEPRIALMHANFAELQGPYDLIWSAGAIYFLGVVVALRQWQPALKPGGAVAFSQVYWKTDKPSKASRDLWEEYPHMPFEAEVYDQVRQAGYRVVAGRELPDTAWEEYYRPLHKRIAQLTPGADAALKQVLDATETEIETWRLNKGDFGYLQVVARPE